MFQLDNVSVQDKPYPYFIVDDFLPNNIFQQLITEFPENHYFDKLIEGQVGRKILGRWVSDFYNFLNTAPTWKKLYTHFVSEDFLSQCFEIFKAHLNEYNLNYNTLKLSNHVFGFEKRLTRIRQRFSRYLGLYRCLQYLLGDQFCISFSINRAKHGYYVPPHHDCRHKILVFLYFLNDAQEIGGSGGEFVMHQLNSPKHVLIEYPQADALEVHKIIKPKKNTAVFFLNTLDSYHSVTKLLNPKDDRKFLYCSIAHRWKQNAWC